MLSLENIFGRPRTQIGRIVEQQMESKVQWSDVCLVFLL
jgi:hypothetical protein